VAHIDGSVKAGASASRHAQADPQRLIHNARAAWVVQAMASLTGGMGGATRRPRHSPASGDRRSLLGRRDASISVWRAGVKGTVDAYVVQREANVYPTA
jgi:hypothetical protein